MIYHSIRMNGSLHGTTSGPHGTGELIELLRTLADPIRLRLLGLLEAQVGGAAAGLSVGGVGEILKLPQSTVSRHLKTLADAGMAEGQRDGTSTLYKINESNGNGGGETKQLRQLARAHLEHDAVAKGDLQRLAAVLRKREP